METEINGIRIRSNENFFYTGIETLFRLFQTLETRNVQV